MSNARCYLRSLIFLVGLLTILPVTAEQSLPRGVHLKLIQVQKLMEKESWEEARTLLADMDANLEPSFAKALVAESLGQIYFHRDQYGSALLLFQRAFDSGRLSQEKNLRLLHIIAQLHCNQEEWRACRAKLSRWIEASPEKSRADDYLVLAQAWSVTEDWAQVIAPVNQALKMKPGAPVSWYQLRVAAFMSLEQWEKAIVAQKGLLAVYPSRAHEWRRLVSINLRLGNHKAALAAMRIPYEQGLLTTAQDFRQMAQLMLSNDLPYLAGRTLVKGMENGTLSRNASDLKLLTAIWLQAKELEKATQTLVALHGIDPQRKWLKQLAELHIRSQQWQDAIDVLHQALKGKPDPRLELLLGIALINVEQFDGARVALEAAFREKKLRTVSKNWLDYLDQLKV